MVTIPLPQTCIGPLELGPKNTVIGVPLIVVGIPEPQTGLAAGELLILDVALVTHGQGVLEG